MISIMDNYKYKYKLLKVNIIMLYVILLSSIISHMIAGKIISIFGIPIISSTFTYMFVISSIYFVRAYSSIKNALILIFFEITFIGIFSTFNNYISNFKSPEWVIFNEHNFGYVMHTVQKLYFDNLIGFIALIIVDLLLFSFLFSRVFYKFRLRVNYFLSTIITMLITLSIYTYITDYLFFHNYYPNQWFYLTNINFISNAILVAMYSMFFSIILKNTIKYIN